MNIGMKAANCVNIKNTATNIEKKVNIILDVLSPILQIHNNLYKDNQF